MAAAVAAGDRELVALTIVSAAETPTPPCGICRQTLAELAPHLPIRSVYAQGQAEYSLRDLIPHAFDRSQLGRRD
jgi:cytidine deaminase